MPTIIICNWCQYVGQGNNYEEQIEDVERHEDKECSERPKDE